MIADGFSGILAYLMISERIHPEHGQLDSLYKKHG